MNLAINLLAFKAGWIASVLGSANGLPFIGPLFVMAAICIHLYRVSEPRRELSLVLMTGVIGFSADSFLVASGWLQYSNGVFLAGLAPYWIIGMWMLFATTLNVAFRWLQERLLLATLLGAVSGPASYFAGAKAGAVELVEPVAALLALAVVWALVLPALMVLARQFDGTQLSALQSRA